MKQKELQMELHRLEEEGAVRLQYEKETLDARDPGSDDGAALFIRSRSPFDCKSPTSKDVFGWLDQSDKFANFLDCSFDHTKNSTITVESVSIEKAYFNPDPQRFKLNR